MGKNLAKVKIIGACACFLVLFFTINFWSDISQKILNRQQDSLSHELTIGNAIHIEQILSNATTTSSLLTSQLTSQPTNLNHLSLLADTIVSNYQEVEQIRLSPKNITTHVFPHQFTPKYIGKIIVPPLPLQHSPDQLTTFYSVPQLINNKYIVKCHIPISIEDKHWGYISYHLNLDSIIKQSQLMQLDASSYSYQLVHLGAFNKSTILAESTTPLQKDFYSAAIRIPNNEWFLKLSFNNQSTNPLYIINFIFSVMLASVFTLIGYLGLSEPSRLRQNLKQLGQRFESQQLILKLILDNVYDEVYVADRNGKVYLNSAATHHNCHLPSNIVLEDSASDPGENVMYELDAKTPIHSSEHPINKSLFNNETVTKQIMLMPKKCDPYVFELKSLPVFDALDNHVGALCVGQKINLKVDKASSTNSRNIVLDMLAHDKPIKSIFERIIEDTQENLEGIVAAITLINPKTQKVNDVISTQLPQFYIDALIGITIADRVMSNCSAMFHDKLVIVEDIELHPFWVDYKALAHQAKFRSCWSQPIHDANNNVLGSIDLYSPYVYQTDPAAIMLIKETAILCSLTLERHRDSHRLQKMSLAVQHSSNAVIITDNEGLIEYTNPHYTKVTGFSPIENLGTLTSILDHDITPSQIINDITRYLDNGKKWQGELKGFTKKRGDYWAMVSVTPILSQDNKINHLVFVLEDITQINQAIGRIDYHNSHDPLTNLYNRQAFEHRLQFLFSKAQDDIRTHCLCAINIDQYNDLKQQSGHQASDELLRQVSHIFSQQLRRRDTLARLGSDQFVVLMEDCDSVSALRAAKDLITTMKGFKFNWAGCSLDISLSIGICDMNSFSESAGQVARQADMACNKAKSLSEESIIIYKDIGIELPLSGDLYWADQIRCADEQDRFQLFVQPIIPIKTSKVKRYEVLLRLRDSKGNLVYPDTFMPAAIRYNLSLMIDKWVVEQIIDWCVNQPQLLLGIDKIYINLSADALIDESFSLYLINKADEHPGIFTHFTFEFSQYHLLNNLARSKRFIDVLTPFGCEFSVDNFGQGLCSFSHLKDLSISTIKVDGPLIKSIIDDPIAGATLQSIIHLSHAMNIDIVATNVETQAIENKLCDYKIDYAQGFLLGTPFLLQKMRS